jgi:mono/diheme cytochrome c family protein
MKNVLITTLALVLVPMVHAEDKVDFAKSIQPIFESRCLSCHGEKKQKGGLRLDSKEALLKGGDDGKVIAAKAEESEIFKRITLPAGDDDIMPAKGDPLTKDQIALIKDWINQGANWPDGLILKKAGAGEKAGSSKNDVAQTDFAKHIQPIFEGRCLECHGAKKQKGDLRLDTKEALLKGGKDGKVLAAKAGESELFKRVSLPKDDDDIMPPKGDPLTKEQIDFLKEWINKGAPWPEGLTLNPGEKGKTGGQAKAPGAEFAGLVPTKDTAAEQQAIQKLAGMGVSVRPIAQNLKWKEATIRPQDTNKLGEILAELKSVPSLVQLNLAGQHLKDADLKNIASLSNLQRLHLENNPITDSGLEHLKGLVHLEYLNLYNTQVSDAGLDQLKTLTNLSHLYLWGSKATADGAEKLRKLLPEASINIGEELKQMAKVEEEKKESESKAAKPDEKKTEPKKEDKAADKPAEKKA